MTKAVDNELSQYLEKLPSVKENEVLEDRPRRSMRNKGKTDVPDSSVIDDLANDASSAGPRRSTRRKASESSQAASQHTPVRRSSRIRSNNESTPSTNISISSRRSSRRSTRSMSRANESSPLPVTDKAPLKTKRTGTKSIADSSVDDDALSNVSSVRVTRSSVKNGHKKKSEADSVQLSHATESSRKSQRKRQPSEEALAPTRFSRRLRSKKI